MLAPLRSIPGSQSSSLRTISRPNDIRSRTLAFIGPPDASAGHAFSEYFRAPAELSTVPFGAERRRARRSRRALLDRRWRRVLPVRGSGLLRSATGRSGGAGGDRRFARRDRGRTPGGRASVRSLRGCPEPPARAIPPAGGPWRPDVGEGRTQALLLPATRSCRSRYESSCKGSRSGDGTGSRFRAGPWTSA